MTLDVGQRDVTLLPLSWEGGEKRGKLDNDTSVDEECPLSVNKGWCAAAAAADCAP